MHFKPQVEINLRLKVFNFHVRIVAMSHRMARLKDMPEMHWEVRRSLV